MWWRFEEAGREDNNMGLPLAILRYKSGYYEVAVLRGVEVPEERPSRRRHQTRVVCSPDCWIIEVENIGSAVTEEETKGEREGYGRVETRNSRGERFSLDRYHFLPHPAHATNPLVSLPYSHSTRPLLTRLADRQHRFRLSGWDGVSSKACLKPPGFFPSGTIK